MPRVTLSYRRDDSAGIARLIFERLKPRYGSDSVFMDIDAIEFGEDYRERIHHALRQTDYLLVLIGPRWLGPGVNGRNRINDANDPVRMEVERALEIGLRVVPILLEHTPMPGPEELPETLGRLPYLNAAEVTAGREFDSQIERIVRFIDRTFAEIEARRAREAQERAEELRVSAPPAHESSAHVDAPEPAAEAAASPRRANVVPAERSSVPVPARPWAAIRWSRNAAVFVGVFVVLCVGGVLALLNSHALSGVKAAPKVTARPKPAAPRFAAAPGRAAAAVPAGFVVMYDRLGGLFWKVTECEQTGSGAQIGFQLFNDYGATADYEVALTKRADHPAASDWLPGRRHLTRGASAEYVRTIAGYTCGAGALYAGLRNVRFGPDRGPYVRL